MRLSIVSTRTRRRAFTLIELLVVIAIIGVLIGLAVPAIQGVKESSRRVQCLENLHNIGIALKNYHTQHKAYPIGCLERKKRRIAWSAYLLPQIDEKPAFDLFHFDQPYNSAANHDATRSLIRVYLCPSTARYGPGRNGDTTGDRNGNGKYDPGDDMGCIDYGGMYGSANFDLPANGVLIYDRAIREQDITDGLQWTILVAEDSGRGPSQDGEWANGENIFDVAGRINLFQDNEIWSDHPGGACVVFCDGHAQFLSATLSVDVLNRLCTRAGSETVNGDELGG